MRQGKNFSGRQLFLRKARHAVTNDMGLNLKAGLMIVKCGSHALVEFAWRPE